MADHSAIEWTDATWNPTTGCTKISPGCAHCYIERTPAFRIAGRKFTNGRIPLHLHTDRLQQPRHWLKPRRVFVNSLSDLFHEEVPDWFIGFVFDEMAMSPRHIFQVLTKRPDRMRALVPRFAERHTAKDGSGWPLPNVWLGVSVENQHFADERIPLLLDTPAAIRFISAEPLLGPVDLEEFLPGRRWEKSEHAMDAPLSWVIVGGESGPGARPCDLGWLRHVVAQCEYFKTPVFVKQLGAKAIGSFIDGDDASYTVRNRAGVLGLRDRKGGDITEWPEDLRVREWPAR
jgi:protein gp37